MSYDTVIDQVKSLPESSLEDVSRYIEFLLYQQEQDRMAPLIESDEVFEQKMERGYADAMEDRVRFLDEVFSDLKKNGSRDAMRQTVSLKGIEREKGLIRR